jgi:hypothetical protein
MRSDKQHTNHSPRQRLQAVAEILARGFLRLRALDLAPKVSPATDREISAIPLELSAETSLSGDSGLRDREARKQNEPT